MKYYSKIGSIKSHETWTFGGEILGILKDAVESGWAYSDEQREEMRKQIEYWSTPIEDRAWIGNPVVSIKLGDEIITYQLKDGE